MSKSYSLIDLNNIDLIINKPSLVFLYGDLGSGKTTLSSILIKKHANYSGIINSPTYTYYNKYNDVYHFDLYRLKDYDEFVSIAGEEVLDNNEGIIFIEWPELIEEYYEADIKIYLNKTSDNNLRDIEIIKKEEC